MEYYGAELTGEQYQRLFYRANRRIKESGRSVFADVHIRPLAEIDLTNAELVRQTQGSYYHLMRLWSGSKELPPPRRTWYNRCLMPLSWTAEVVDIPLSAIATPIGWVVDAIYEPMNN